VRPYNADGWDHASNNADGWDHASNNADGWYNAQFER